MNAAFTHRVIPGHRDAGALARQNAGGARPLDDDAAPIETIGRLLGAGAAARLIARFGGRRVYIAKRPNPAAALSQTVGHGAAVKLGAIFGGERIWLPNGAGDATRARVAQLRRDGISVSRIAGELGLSERHVYKVLAQLRAR